MKYLIPILILFTISCNDTSKPDRDLTLYTFNKAGYVVTEVEGHQYLSYYKGGIIHMESCPCKKIKLIP